MNIELKEKFYAWADALESGKYEQYKGALRHKDKFCCLGVLCELEKIPAEIKEDFFYSYRDNLSSLPRLLVEKYNLSGYARFDPEKLSTELQQEIMGAASCLADLNDDGFDFKFIAKVIREITDNDGWISYGS